MLCNVCTANPSYTAVAAMIVLHCILQLSLPVEVTTRTTYLNLYVHYILELQKRARAAGDNDARLPLIIMTSEVSTITTLNKSP
jgi:hypothetical protein